MRRILVVEDDLELVELLRFNLTNVGFSVMSANDGAEAIEKACSLLPDLIVLDVMLPVLDGFAVCEILRREASTAAIPIIMLTAMSTRRARLAGLESGANDYITKPFSPKNLLGRIETVLSQFAPAAEKSLRHPSASGASQTEVL